MSGITVPPLRSSIRRTPVLIGAATRRRDGSAVFAMAVFGYLVLYLWAIGDLSPSIGVGFEYMLVEQPFQRMFELAPGAYSYEPIALLRLGVATYLFSPINTGIGLGLAILVGWNMALSYLAITQPRSCGLEAGAGVLAAVPALLAGSACCAPALLLFLGIMATGTILAILPWLVPLGILGLLASLVYLAGQIDPSVVA